LGFPAAFKDANGFLTFHFTLVCGNIMDRDVVGLFDMIRDVAGFEFNMELLFGVTTDTARKQKTAS
jgi:hypothetical protein